MAKITDKRRWQWGLGILLILGLIATFLASGPFIPREWGGDDDILLELAGLHRPLGTVEKTDDLFSIEREKPYVSRLQRSGQTETAPQGPAFIEPESAFGRRFGGLFQKLKDLVASKKPEVALVGCDPQSSEIPLEDVACLERRRKELNRGNTDSRGDAELFFRTLAFVRDVSPKAPIAGRVLEPNVSRVFDAWRVAGDSERDGGDLYWRDQKYFYRYVAQLGLGGLISPRSLTSADDFQSTLNSALVSQKNVARPDFFSTTANFKLGSKQDGDIALGKSMIRRPLLFEADKGVTPVNVGFVFDNRTARLGFAFHRQGLDYSKIPEVTFRGGHVLADFPGPMHADGPRLIELGIRNGRIVNFLMGGGARRSGIVVVTADGRAFPFHVQAIAPAIWGSQSNLGTLDLSRSYSDLISFLTLARDEKLSVFMEMLLAEEEGANQALVPIANFAKARGRRLLVWSKQSDGYPSLLVVNNGLSINHAVWAAHKLGYRWAINLDCDFIDGARYFAAGGPKMWGTKLESTVETEKKNPYSRLMFFDER